MTERRRHEDAQGATPQAGTYAVHLTPGGQATGRSAETTLGREKHAEARKAPKPVTAQPVGRHYIVCHDAEDMGENLFTNPADGCYQRQPTCRDNH